MTTVHDILDFLFSIAPAYMKEDWDTVGLFCGHSDRVVSRVLIALDPSEDAIAEAIASGAQLLVTHHPLIFHATKNVSDQTPDGRKVLSLIESGIAVISMHTNLDIAEGGVNDCLADALQLQKKEIFHMTGDNFGLGRIGTVPTQCLTDFVQHVKSALQLPGLRYTDGGKAVTRVAVGGGACVGLLEEAAQRGCDTFVTADVKYHEFQQAQQLGLNLIDAGHFGTENPVCTCLQTTLSSQFPDLAVRISTRHCDVVEFA